MAIKDSDSFSNQIVNKTFTIGVGSSEEFVQQLSEINSQPYNDSRVNLSIVCASLDAVVTLNQLQGNNETFDDMSPILDTQSGSAVSDVLDNGNYVIYTELRTFFLGLELVYGSATTGTVIVTIRA